MGSEHRPPGLVLDGRPIRAGQIPVLDGRQIRAGQIPDRPDNHSTNACGKGRMEVDGSFSEDGGTFSENLFAQTPSLNSTTFSSDLKSVSSQVSQSTQVPISACSNDERQAQESGTLSSTVVPEAYSGTQSSADALNQSINKLGLNLSSMGQSMDLDPQDCTVEAGGPVNRQLMEAGSRLEQLVANGSVSLGQAPGSVGSSQAQ